MKSAYTRNFDGITARTEAEQKVIDKMLECNSSVPTSGVEKNKKRFTWNFRRSIFAASAAAVFSFMSVAIIILSVLVATAGSDLPPDGSGSNPPATAYALYTDVKLETVSQQHDILIPSWGFFGAPENISMLKDKATQNDSFIKILYRNYEGDEYGGIIRKNETLTFNIVLDSKYEFSEIDLYQNLDKTGTNQYLDMGFKYDTKNDIVYATFSYKNNNYYLQYTAEGANENDLAYMIERFYQQYVKVSSVSINLYDSATTIPYTKSSCLDINIYPFEATYRDYYNFYIDKIVKKDGTLYTGNLSKYAYIDNNNNFYTTKDIEIGAKIYIYAMAETDKIKSNVLEIEIVRIPVDRIELVGIDEHSNQYISTAILLGSETIFNIETYPTDASYNYLNDSEIQIEIADESLVTITKINEKQYLVKASNNYDDRLKDVEITVTVDGCTRKFIYSFQTIRAENVELYNSETGEPLERTIALPRNSVLKTTALITPANAHGKVSYNYTSNTPNSSIYVSYENGILSIKDNAPFGMEIYISASIAGKSSGSYKIVVTKVPVESVTITTSKFAITPFDETTMNVGDCMVIFQLDIGPDNADVTIIEWKILNAETLPEVFISGNMIFASAAAPVGEIIEIQAVVDGIESNILRILIVE